MAHEYSSDRRRDARKRAGEGLGPKERRRLERARDAADAFIQTWARRVCRLEDDLKKYRNGLN